MDEAVEEDPQPLEYIEFHRSVVVSLLVDFGIDIGAFTREGDITKQFLDEILTFASEWHEAAGISAINGSLFAALLGLAWDNCAGNGLPSVLLLQLADMIREIYFGEMLS
ncbi:hypothetical protein ACH4PU_07425 [Streptomyces sp. NPDC021100]|uniref:hypothetical protein n=1 Tax=Streptomyces sp. NPDC021100 TaxID=3365114 RepID=UPI0037B842C1